MRMSFPATATATATATASKLKRRPLALCLAWLAITTASTVLLAQSPGDPTNSEPAVRIVDQAPGVTLALRPHQVRFDDGNSAYVSSERGVLIVDAPTDPEVIKHWVAKAKAEGQSIRWVLNTHWHSDHNQGNQQLQAAFPDVEIVGHHSLRGEVPNRAATAHHERVARLTEQIPAARSALANGKGLSGQDLTAEQIEAQATAISQGEEWLDTNRAVEFLAPTVSFDHALQIDLGKHTAELHHFRAHTSGDTVLVLRELRIAFTGDLLDELPFIGHGSPRSWVQALDVIERLDVDTFVPGHGDPFGKEHLRVIRDYLAQLIAAVDEAKSSGVSLEDARQSLTFPQWRKKLATDDIARRFFDNTVADAVAAAWNEQ